MLAENHPDSYYAASISRPFKGDKAEGDLDADVCIVGGGYTGISAALHLAQRGHSVILLEAQKIGWGASGRNGGQVCTGQRKEQDDLEQMLGRDHARHLWKLSEEAKATLRTLISNFDIQCDYKAGIAHPDHKPQYSDDTKNYVEALNRDYDYDQIEYIDHEEMARLTGSDTYFGGSLDHGAGHLHPLNYVLGLAHATREAGVKIFENSEVLDYHAGQDVTVRVQNFRVRSGHMVLACNGLFTDPLGHRVIGTRVIRRDIGRAHDHFRAECLQHIRFLFGLLVVGGEDAFITAHDGDECQAHAGVSRGAFNDRAARLQLTRFFGVVDDLDGDAIFDGVTGVKRIHLGQHRGLDVANHLVELDQGCVADRFQYIFIIHSIFLKMRRQYSRQPVTA